MLLGDTVDGRNPFRTTLKPEKNKTTHCLLAFCMGIESETRASERWCRNLSTVVALTHTLNHRQPWKWIKYSRGKESKTILSTSTNVGRRVAGSPTIVHWCFLLLGGPLHLQINDSTYHSTCFCHRRLQHPDTAPKKHARKFPYKPCTDRYPRLGRKKGKRVSARWTEGRTGRRTRSDGTVGGPLEDHLLSGILLIRVPRSSRFERLE